MKIEITLNDNVTEEIAVEICRDFFTPSIGWNSIRLKKFIKKFRLKRNNKLIRF